MQVQITDGSNQELIPILLEKANAESGIDGIKSFIVVYICDSIKI